VPQVGFVRPTFTLDAAVAGLLGGAGLSPADARQLDGLGTRMGAMTWATCRPPSTPNADDGAQLFRVHGPAIDSALAGSGALRLFTRRADDTTLVGALVGAIASGTVVTLQVGDVNEAGRYTGYWR